MSYKSRYDITKHDTYITKHNTYFTKYKTYVLMYHLNVSKHDTCVVIYDTRIFLKNRHCRFPMYRWHDVRSYVTFWPIVKIIISILTNSKEILAVEKCKFTSTANSSLLMWFALMCLGAEAQYKSYSAEQTFEHVNQTENKNHMKYVIYVCELLVP